MTTSMSCSTIRIVRSVAMRRISATMACVSVTLMPAVGSSRQRSRGSVASTIDDIGVRAMVVEQAPCVMTRLGGDSDVLEHRGAGQDVGDLVRACDGLPGDPVRRKPRDVLAGKEDAAARRAKHARDAVEER